MKKLILAAAIAATAAAGGYFYHLDPKTDSDIDPLLTLIPAESAFVSFATEDYDHYQYLHAFGYAQESLYDYLDDRELTAEQAFIIQYLDGYLQSAVDKQTLKTYLGTPDNIKPVMYTLGLVPVYKLQLENSDAFWRTISQVEQETGATYQAGQFGEVTYRRYRLTEEEDEDIGLIIAVGNQVATFTLDLPMLGEENPLKLALGIEKPQLSFAQSDRFSELKTKYGQQYSNYAYLDHQAIIQGLTQPASNRIARQLEVLQQQTSEPFLDEIRHPNCQTELAAIARNWPRTVGLAEYSMHNGQAAIKGKLVIESHNQVLINALKAIRGFLPEVTDPTERIFSIGLGLDVSKLATSVGSIWNDLRQPSYSCGLLADFQQSLGDENPATMLSLGASMLGSVKGMHFALNDLTLDTEHPFGPQWDKLDFLFTLSANQPENLLLSAQMFVPELAQLTLEANGEPIDLSTLVSAETGIQTPLFARLNDKHLALYSGAQSATSAEAILKQPLTAKGLFQFDVNMPRFMEAMRLAAEFSGEELPEELMHESTSNVITQFVIDINDSGITVDYHQHSTTPVQ
ncbi:Uncharacterised protein [Vibrio metschnikovii]|uniref:hypothetical protein n=1 Tax=Vibrio metschnikovii TaxID=28172 RepID=UPI0001B944F8|nr:hypothetical protein [Vibrio metschnikovii]EEX37358.1 hypothetical protein VIB_001478 [Vibrio metschnikovii CIP 69.14]SUP08713.1 Uncharacterised protein [Vibrio metschnikovii]SUP51789.1 Uncharacterised protein [Vibrio metschnikovii]